MTEILFSVVVTLFVALIVYYVVRIDRSHAAIANTVAVFVDRTNQSHAAIAATVADVVEDHKRFVRTQVTPAMQSLADSNAQIAGSVSNVARPVAILADAGGAALNGWAIGTIVIAVFSLSRQLYTKVTIGRCKDANEKQEAVKALKESDVLRLFDAVCLIGILPIIGHYGWSTGKAVWGNVKTLLAMVSTALSGYKLVQGLFVGDSKEEAPMLGNSVIVEELDAATRVLVDRVDRAVEHQQGLSKVNFVSGGIMDSDECKYPTDGRISDNDLEIDEKVPTPLTPPASPKTCCFWNDYLCRFALTVQGNALKEVEKNISEHQCENRKPFNRNSPPTVEVEVDNAWKGLYVMWDSIESKIHLNNLRDISKKKSVYAPVIFIVLFAIVLFTVGRATRYLIDKPVEQLESKESSCDKNCKKSCCCHPALFVEKQEGKGAKAARKAKRSKAPGIEVGDSGPRGHTSSGGDSGREGDIMVGIGDPIFGGFSKRTDKNNPVFMLDGKEYIMTEFGKSSAGSRDHYEAKTLTPEAAKVLTPVPEAAKTSPTTDNTEKCLKANCQCPKFHSPTKTLKKAKKALEKKDRVTVPKTTKEEELDVKKLAWYKTLTCKLWTGEVGSCKFGDKCKFAHVLEKKEALVNGQKFIVGDIQKSVGWATCGDSSMNFVLAINCVIVCAHIVKDGADKITFKIRNSAGVLVSQTMPVNIGKSVGWDLLAFPRWKDIVGVPNLRTAESVEGEKVELYAYDSEVNFERSAISHDAKIVNRLVTRTDDAPDAFGIKEVVKGYYGCSSVDGNCTGPVVNVNGKLVGFHNATTGSENVFLAITPKIVGAAGGCVSSF
jgi:hypothetical protein